MGQEFSAKAFHAEFPHFGVAAIVRPGKDPAMDLVTETDEIEDVAPATVADRPHASDWLWRPWYAKLWWTGIAVYWAGKAGTFTIPVLHDFYTSTLAGFLNIFFFPPLALMVLGLGFAREWFAWSDWEFVELTHEQMFRRKSVGGLSDPYSDPLDPRSGMLHWRHFHPKR